MTPDPFILCENLVKIYSLSGVEVVALQGLDLAVEPGEMVGIVGASGSGKTTLLNVLGGLDRPSAGHVQVGGRDLLKLSDADLDAYRRSQVGFVWQQTTRNLIPYLTALENVEIPMRLANHPGAERRQRAQDLLDALDLSERLHHLPAALSGGEQQRVAIAVALANRPQILLADEPTGEVDTATAHEIYAALRKMSQTYGITALIVSHDPNLGHFTDRVVAIRDGKTSAEVVRYVPRAAIESRDESITEKSSSGDGGKSPEFEELIVLDSAGRLQIPRDYLEMLDIGDRVRLELRDGDILIHPVSGRGRGQGPSGDFSAPGDLYLTQDQAPEEESRSVIGRVRHLAARMRWPSRRGELKERKVEDE
jgi:ABC-type lipoprotein export system ATPase subunit